MESSLPLSLPASTPSSLPLRFLPLTEAKLCCQSLPLRGPHYLGGAWAPGSDEATTAAAPPTRGWALGPQHLPRPVYLSRLLPSRPGPVSASARESTQYTDGRLGGRGQITGALWAQRWLGTCRRLHSSRRAEWRSLSCVPCGASAHVAAARTARGVGRARTPRTPPWAAPGRPG